MYEDLTQKQIEILHFIQSHIQKQGYPPAVREICKGVDLKSTSTVHRHLEKLEEKGYIRKDPTKPRAIEILDQGEDSLFTPKKNCGYTYYWQGYCRPTHISHRAY